MQRDPTKMSKAPIADLTMLRQRLLRAAAITLAALVVFGLILVVDGKDPLRAYHDTLVYIFGNRYGFSELLVRMSPLILTAVAAALPSRLGLINVGGEGQLYMGGWLATAGALGFPDLSAWLLLPLLTVLGFLGGALWALLPALLRAGKIVNETISTLLLNYVAPLIVSYFIFGPWRSEESSSYPQSSAFVPAARLPTFDGTRIHLGLVYGVVCVALYGYVLARTRWGLNMRAIGGNAEASLRLGIPLSAYVIAAMMIAGGIAGIAGMVEVSAIQGRLVAQLSPGYGYIGFLVAWLAGGSAAAILLMAFLLAAGSSVGDILQITQGVPSAVVNILIAVILFIVLGQRQRPRAAS
jgi:general nucleoside transport system permease protein